MATVSERQLSLEVLKKFRLIYGSVRQQFRQVEEKCGMTGSQLWILQEIEQCPGIGISDLAGQLSIHQTTCSQLVDKLVVRNLVLKKRNKEDQRRVGLVISSTAKRILKDAPGPAEGILPEALLAMPDRLLRNLDVSLAEVINQLQIRDEKLAHRPLSDL